MVGQLPMMEKEGSETVIKCNQLKMETANRKRYIIDVADLETLFLLIQSAPRLNEVSH